MAKTQLIESQIGVALGMHRAGASQRAIAKQLSVKQPTVSRFLRNVSITTFKTRSPRRVYKRSTTNRESRSIARLAVKLRRITLQDLTNQLGLNVSKRTIAHRLREITIHKRVAKTKPHLTPQYMSARLEWAEQ